MSALKTYKKFVVAFLDWSLIVLIRLGFLVFLLLLVDRLTELIFAPADPRRLFASDALQLCVVFYVLRQLLKKIFRKDEGAESNDWRER